MKKGVQSIIIIPMVMIIGIIVLVYVLADHSGKYAEVSKGEKTGERQFELFSVYAMGERALFYAESSAIHSAPKAEKALALNGGLGYEIEPLTKSFQLSSPCGRIGEFVLWRNLQKECYPENVEQSFGMALENELGIYFVEYKETTIPTKYEFKLKDSEIVGLAKEEIILRSDDEKVNEHAKAQTTDLFTYKIKPSFRIKYDNSLEDYETLSKKAKEIVKKCDHNAQIDKCVDKNLDSPLKIQRCGETEQRFVKLCAGNKGIEYKFAIAISPPVSSLGNCKVEDIIGEFSITSYYTPLQSDFDNYHDFEADVAMQGSGKLNDGRILRYDGSIIEGKDLNGVTRTGANPMPKKTIAVDMSVIPTGTPVFIDFENEHSGFFLAEDTGGAIIGNKIDVYRGVGKETLKPGLPGKVNVFKATCVSEESRPPAKEVPLPSGSSLISPNRGGPITPKGVIMHSTRGGREPGKELDITLRWFMTPESKVSSHAVIGVNGDLYLMVPDTEQAWHAGYLNSNYLGIELEQGNIEDEFSEKQYTVAAELVKHWASKYGFPTNRETIVGHEETSQGKSYYKTDPGYMFNWDKFMGLLAK